MGDLKPDSEDKGEMDDSGCVQDDTPPGIKKPPDVMEDDYRGYAHFLDLSDDVLLCILKWCTPQDLKALGYTCERLSGLVRDRTLWLRVDARSQPCGRKRLRWMLANVLNEHTTELHLAGYAREARGCLGHVERAPDPPPGRRPHLDDCVEQFVRDFDDMPEEPDRAGEPPDRAGEPPYPLHRQHARLHINAQQQQLPRFSGMPAWDDNRGAAAAPPPAAGPSAAGPSTAGPSAAGPSAAGPSAAGSSAAGPSAAGPSAAGPSAAGPSAAGPSAAGPSAAGPPVAGPSAAGPPVAGPSAEPPADAPCGGPLFTVTPLVLAALCEQCPRLTTLSLEYCNINCKKTTIGQLPETLKILSLRGTKCYNLPMDKSFLFKIHHYLPLLEIVDLSECEWMEPASLLPLSKLEGLRHLFMQDCFRLTEFVAYASLATRYGFRKLKVLDLRGSPVGDSEVSALGWVPVLQELYLAPARPPPDPVEHSHRKGDPLPHRPELEPWEVEVEFGSQPEPDSSDVSDADSKALLPDCCRKGKVHHTHEGDLIHVTLRRRPLDANGIPILDENDPAYSRRHTLKPTGAYWAPVRADYPGTSKSSHTSFKTQKDNKKTSGNSSKISENGCNTYKASYKTLENSNKHGTRPDTGVNDPDTPQRANAESSEATAENIAKNIRMTRSKRADSTCMYPESSDSTHESTGNRQKRSWKSETGDKSHESGENVKSSDKAQESASKTPEANVNKRETRSKKHDNGDKAQGSDKNPEFGNKTPESTNKRDKRSKKPDSDDKSDDNDKIRESSQNTLGSDKTLEPNVNKRVTRSSKQGSGDKSPDTNTKRETRSKKPEDKNDTSDQTPETKKPTPESTYKGKRRIITETPESSKKIKVVYQNEINEGASSSKDTNDSALGTSLNTSANSVNRETRSSKSDSNKTPEAQQSSGKNKLSMCKGKHKIVSDSGEPTTSTKKPKDGIPNDINEGASTSRGVRSAGNPGSSAKFVRKARSLSPKGRADSDSSDSEDDDTSTKPNNGSTSSTSSEASQNGRQYGNYVRFRQNHEPVLIQCPAAPEDVQEAEPRHHVLYVNVGQQLHAVYRLMPNRPIFHSIRNRNWRQNIRNAFYGPPAPHIDSSALVTDAAVRRFGRADGEDINYIHIGQHGPMLPNASFRPNRTSLRILSITGFRNITDRSLVHLATAAPHLRILDFTETGVSDRGIENFRSLRPECEVTYSKLNGGHNGDVE